MTDPSFQLQASLTSVPSTPSWFGEVAVVAHAFKQFGLSKATLVAGAFRACPHGQV